MIKYSKQTIQLANEIVSVYDADLSRLTSSDIAQVAARIMTDEPEYAIEATGPDNPVYDPKMFPAMIKWMRNQADLDSLMDFRDAWQEGINAYMLKPVMDLLEWRVAEHNIRYGLPYKKLNGYDTQEAGRDYICTGQQ